MGNFRWLHISDLHFENITQYPIADIRDSFYKKLQQVCDEHPFDYVFITGDIADKNDYRASEENIKFLKDALKIDPNKIFWAPGNHDIVRKEKSYRSRLISDMRHGDLRFDEALQDDENRMLLLRPFQEYVKRNEQFLGYRPSSCLHNFYACEHLDIIVLNTSITSCDNQDNGNLFILNTDLIKCFNCHQSGRPLFVLGHHDISCFSIDEQKYLADKFDHSNVDLYLCGHQHRLNFDNLPGISRNLPQCVVGGGTDKNYCDFSFLVGDYDAEKNCFHIAPYVFNKNGNRTWNLDYNYLPRLTQDNQTSCCSFSKMGDVKITVPYLEKLQKEYSYLFPCTNYSAACPDNIKSKIQKFSLCVLKYIAQNINKNSLVSQDIVFLCSVAIKSDAFKNIDLNSICNLHLNEKCSWFEVYRGFYNTCQIIAILAEKEASMPPVPFEAFDFSKFYADVDQFNTDDTYYILVTDSLHDISADRLSVLANMPWNIIIDFDGTTDEGGLRQYLQRSSKSLYAQNNNLEEILFTKNFPVWLTFNDSFCRNSALSDITFNGLKLLYRKLATKLKESFSGDCTVIFLKQKDTSDNILISELFDRFGENCKFFFISSTYEDIKSELNAILFDSYGNNLNNYFVYSSNIYSFLTSLLEYRNSLLVQPIHSEKNSFPTIDGLKSLSENIYVNLSDCFELLTSDIGSDSSVHIENRDNFYKGHIATWDLFAQEDIVNVMHPEVYKNYLNLIKSSMATKLENPRGHIFTLLHAAGFGGTTLSRQIAWDFHLSHPVLLVHHYDPNQFVQRIRQLYDQHCRMGMLLIADENDLTASELENIEKDSLILDRPLALLIVKRDRDSGRTIRNKRVLRLNVLSYITIQSLKSRFSAASPLSKETLKIKYDNFPTVFGKNATPACPFFIGLYFMEKDFEGVISYTKSIIQNLSSKDELETLAMLSFLDIYSGLGISNQMVRIWITVNTKSTYLGSYPYASEAFIAVSDAVYNISLIKGRNIILSEELFKQCIEKLYNCSPEEKLRQFAEKLIETVSKCCISGVSEYYQDLLEKIFITKYNGDSTATNESFLATDFSSLILAIPSPESKELVFNKLTSTFTTTVSNLSYEENISAYLMLSHFWGHFGRLYRSREMGSLVNYNKAIECCKKAEEIMLITERQDPYIYHMHGDSVSRKCFDWMSKNEANSDTKTEELDGLVEQAISYFERSMATGEIGRGALSSLDLLIAYLKYIYKCKELTSPNDYYKLDSTQLRYKGLVEDYIDLLEEIPKDYRGSQLFTRLKHEFYSEILFNNFGIAIQYYENRIAIVKNQQGEDSNELYQLRRSLANALIEKFKHKYSYDEPETIVKKDAKRITEILEQNIQRTVTYNDTYDQRQKAIDCYRWFRYAPYSDCSITEALTIVRKWMDLDSINGRSATPLPFYYEYVLLILRLQEGYEISKAEIQEAMQSSYRHAQNTSYSTTQIRNIFTQGHGLSQIKPFMGYPDLRKNFSSIKLMRIEGKFTKNYGLKRDGGLGCITITKPVSLRGLEVFFKMGKGNTVQENQTSHTLEFYVGFTCERMVAFDNLIADITSGETLDDKVSRWLNP